MRSRCHSTEPQGPSIEVISRAHANLVHPEEFFDSGRKCHRGELRDGHGSFCLIGSIDHVGCGDLAFRYLNPGGPLEARALSVRPTGPRRDERSLRRLRGRSGGSGSGHRRSAAIDAFACVTRIPLPCAPPFPRGIMGPMRPGGPQTRADPARVSGGTECEYSHASCGIYRRHLLEGTGANSPFSRGIPGTS